MNALNRNGSEDFGRQRAEELAREAASWDASSLEQATEADIPVVDVARYFETGDRDELQRLGEQVRFIGENIGFHCLVGHGIAQSDFESIFDAAAQFLTLPDEVKRRITIDDPAAAARGIGWLPRGERRLPERAKGNLNEAVLFKQDRALKLEHNPWLPESVVPGFRAAVEAYAEKIERVAMGLLPIYAVALELDPDEPYSLEMWHQPLVNNDTVTVTYRGPDGTIDWTGELVEDLFFRTTEDGGQSVSGR